MYQSTPCDWADSSDIVRLNNNVMVARLNNNAMVARLNNDIVMVARPCQSGRKLRLKGDTCLGLKDSKCVPAVASGPLGVTSRSNTNAWRITILTPQSSCETLSRLKNDKTRMRPEWHRASSLCSNIKPVIPEVQYSGNVLGYLVVALY